jgi:hypothetical protein
VGVRIPGVGYMKEMINMIRTVYYRNKLLCLVIIVVVLAILVVGCNAQGGSPPSGPIGGGCG